jgi:hypothetical protein
LELPLYCVCAMRDSFRAFKEWTDDDCMYSGVNFVIIRQAGRWLWAFVQAEL